MQTENTSPAISMALLALQAGPVVIFNGPEPDELRETITALTQRLRHLSNNSKAIQGRADAEKRDLTPAESQLIDKNLRDFEAVENELKVARAELANAETLENEADLRQPMARLTQPDPIASSDPAAARARLSPRNPTERTGRFSDLFRGRELTDHYAGRFESFGEFALAVANGGHDSRLIRNSTMSTGEGTTGGFLVPTQFLANILDASLSMEVIRPRATVIPMTSKSAVAPAFDFSDGTNGKRAGLQLLWGAEAQQLTEQRGQVREVQLKAHKANIFCRVSAELTADAPLFDQQLSQAMIAATAAGLDIAFLNGTGVGQPLGIIAANNTITVAKEGSQAASTVLLQNVSKMMARLSPASFARSVWLIHPTVVVPLFTMAVVVQNVAGTENVGGSTASAVTVDGNGQLRIFGRPTVVTDACAPLSSVGDIVLCDLSKYLVGVRAEAVIKRDESRYFDSDEIAFKLTLRVDGQPADASATKLRDGTNTTSPFVILQAR